MISPTLGSARRRRCALAAIAVCLGASIGSAGPAQAPRPTRSPRNPRERLLEVRSRGLPGDLGG